MLVTVATALVAAALLWTHYWSMWLLAAVGLLALWRAWRDEDPERRTGARLLIGRARRRRRPVPAVGVRVALPVAPTPAPRGATSTARPRSMVFTVVDFAGAKYGVAHLLTYLLVPLILLGAIAWVQRAPRGAKATPVGPAAEPQQVVLTTRLVPRVRSELLVLLADPEHRLGDHGAVGQHVLVPVRIGHVSRCSCSASRSGSRCCVAPS